MKSTELTGKEEAICNAIFEYPTAKQLAEHFTCSILTIRAQLSSIYAKLGVHSKVDMVNAVAKWKVDKELKKTVKLRDNLRKLVEEYTNPPEHVYGGDDDGFYLHCIKEAIIKRNKIIKKAYETIKELRYALNN